jgi:hypothetical protein
VKAADAGYGEFGTVDRIGLAADHSSRVTQEWKYPIRVMGRSNLELTFNPPAETAEELAQSVTAAQKLVQKIDTRTDGLKKRVPLKDGVSVGPVPGSTKPPQLSYEAMIHVNLGIDPRRVHSLLSWYAGSAYKPRREHLKEPIDVAVDMAGRMVNAFARESRTDVREVQHWNGLRGLTTMLVMYLMAGADTSVLSSSIKNFATLLTKTPFPQLIKYGMTPKEKAWLKEVWNEYTRVLIQMTRVDQDEDSPLIHRTEPGGKVLKDGSWKIKDLLEGAQLPLISESKQIDADDVGPERSGEDLVTGGGKRRKGIVLEFRSLPGRYPPEQWLKVATDFMEAAEKENAQKDYPEAPKPPPQQEPDVQPVEPLVAKGVRERVEQLRALSIEIPVRPVRTPVTPKPRGGSETVLETREVRQHHFPWATDSMVEWEGKRWIVEERLGVGRFRLKQVA